MLEADLGVSVYPNLSLFTHSLGYVLDIVMRVDLLCHAFPP